MRTRCEIGLLVASAARAAAQFWFEGWLTAGARRGKCKRETKQKQLQQIDFACAAPLSLHTTCISSFALCQKMNLGRDAKCAKGAFSTLLANVHENKVSKCFLLIL